MSELQVPDFKSMKDVTKWAKKLTDKEIQSWTTKDWLKFYEKIDAYVESDDFDKVYRKNLKKLIKNGTFDGPIESLTNTDNIMTYKQIAFTELDGGNALCKLNRNYRFEPKQLEIIRELGKEAGKEMAKKNYDLAKLSINNSHKNFYLSKLINDANDIAIEQTEYAQYGKLYTKYFSTETADLGNDTLGLATYEAEEKRKLKINNSQSFDDAPQTAFHEAAHLHMQNGSSIQVKILEKDKIMANPKLGKDFYKLMQKNNEYYIRFTRTKNSSFLNGSWFKINKIKRKQKAYNSYHKQPIEKFSEIYGIEAERTLRAETKQLTERTAIKIAEKISDAATMVKDKNMQYYLKNPSTVKRGKNGIEIMYLGVDANYANCEAEKIADKIKQTLPNDIIKDLNIEISSKEANLVKLTVPNSHDFASRYEKATTKATLKKQAATAAKEIGTQTTKTVKKVGNTILKANAAYDAIVDKNLKTLMEMGAPQWMKNLDNMMVKTVDNKVTRLTMAQLQKWGEDFVKTPTGAKIQQQVLKSYAKMGGDAMAKSLAKKIPLACVALACVMAKERFEKGEYIKGSLEVVSGMAACVPVFGTAVSLGIDATVLASDLFGIDATTLASDLFETGFFKHGIVKGDPNSHMVAESTGYDNQLKRMNELIDKQKKEAQSQKVVKQAAQKAATKEAHKAMEEIKNMTPWSEYSRS